VGVTVTLLINWGLDYIAKAGQGLKMGFQLLIFGVKDRIRCFLKRGVKPIAIRYIT
jgi:hypothetical protein